MKSRFIELLKIQLPAYDSHFNAAKAAKVLEKAYSISEEQLLRDYEQSDGSIADMVTIFCEENYGEWIL